MSVVVSSQFLPSTKEYVASIKFGVSTTTDDVTGCVPTLTIPPPTQDAFAVWGKVDNVCGVVTRSRTGTY